jgi:uncharacterized integral membrane protein
VAAEPARRRWARRVALGVLALALIALSSVFAAANRPQPIRLAFGLVSWRGEAVHALFAAAVVGLGVMFLLGLPADLRARGERRRLERRVAALERELEGERASRSKPAPQPSPPPAGPGLNREEEGVV